MLQSSRRERATVCRPCGQETTYRRDMIVSNTGIGQLSASGVRVQKSSLTGFSGHWHCRWCGDGRNEWKMMVLIIQSWQSSNCDSPVLERYGLKCLKVPVKSGSNRRKSGGGGAETRSVSGCRLSAEICRFGCVYSAQRHTLGFSYLSRYYYPSTRTNGSQSIPLPQSRINVAPAISSPR